MNKLYSNPYFWLTFCVFATWLQLQSCSKKIGCVDQKALNYDPEAEVANSSCIYPNLNLEFKLNAASENFEINRIYNVSGLNLAFKSFQFYVSGIKVHRADMLWEDYLPLTKLIRSDSITFPLGATYTGKIDSFEFNVGLDSIQNSNINFQLYDTEHPLQIQNDTMHFNLNDGYIFLKLVGNVDRNGDGFPNENESFDYRIGTNDLLRQLSFTTDQVLDQTNNSLRVALDVLALLENIDLLNIEKIDHQTQTAAAETIADNLFTSMSLIP